MADEMATASAIPLSLRHRPRPNCSLNRARSRTEVPLAISCTGVDPSSPEGYPAPMNLPTASAVLALAALFLPLAGAPQNPTDLSALQDQAIERLQEYVRVDTINPPGNETRGRGHARRTPRTAP